MSAASAADSQPPRGEGGSGSPDRIRRLALAFRESRVLLSAIELGVFTELASSGPLPAEALGPRVGVHPRGLRDFLDTLVSLDLLERDVDGRYGNTADSARYLDRNQPEYQGLLEMAALRIYPFWAQLTDALRTGEAQKDVAGAGLYSAVYGDEGKRDMFVQGMTSLSSASGRALAEVLDWQGVRTVTDVGCSQGAMLSELVARHPHLAGTGFDLPPVAEPFRAYTGQRGVADRLTFTPGDFFTDPLPAADVVVMGHVLHNWDLDDKRALLRKAYRALPEGGTLVVYESLIDDERRTRTFGMLMSLNMLLQTEAGFDFTGADLRGWLAEVGFREFRTEHLAGPDHVVIATR